MPLTGRADERTCGFPHLDAPALRDEAKRVGLPGLDIGSNVVVLKTDPI
jgi:hypothetical protein